MGNRLGSSTTSPKAWEGQRKRSGRGQEEFLLLFMQNKGPFPVLTTATLMLGRTRGRGHPPGSSGGEWDQRGKLGLRIESVSPQGFLHSPQLGAQAGLAARDGEGAGHHRAWPHSSPHTPFPQRNSCGPHMPLAQPPFSPLPGFADHAPGPSFGCLTLPTLHGLAAAWLLREPSQRSP